MSKQATLLDTTNATFSPGLPAGPTLSNSPAGQKKGTSGPGAVRVRRFRALDNEKAMPTNDICGPLFTHSSPSAALQRSLENRLRALTGVNGSPEYKLTWKEQDMPSGPPICALRARARHTSGKGCSGWPTPKVSLGEYQYSGGNHDKKVLNLEGAVKLVGWPTPDTNKCGGAQDAEKRKAGGHNIRLQDSVLLLGFPTPAARDWRDGRSNQHGKNARPLNEVVTGMIPGPSSAETENTAAYRLNPRFSLWLMGYPDEWASCGEQAMQSCRKLPRSSSQPF